MFTYRIAQNVGGVKLCRNHSTRVIGRLNFGELSRFTIAFQCINNIWMGKLWRIDGQSPNSPMFSPANILRYTVVTKTHNQAKKK